MTVRQRNPRAATALVALALAGGVVAPAAAAGRPGVEGVWRVTGYGTVLSVTDGRLQEYQTTEAGCVRGDSARRTAPGTYTDSEGTVFTLRPRGTLELAGSPGHRELRRIAELPASCGRPMPTGPVAAFDVFWQSFEENYPFFAAKDIDWHAVRDTYRPRVHAGTTRDELFAIFSDMVTPLYDAHVAVLDGDRHFAQVRPGTTMPGEELDTKVKEFVVRRDLGGTALREFAGGRIGYADLPGGQGYLRISGFAGYAGQQRSYAVHQAELDKALDAVLDPERTASLKGLIIDLRINGGGYDSLGLHIAERLTDTPYVAYRKRTQVTRPQPITVRPAPGVPRYTGPVALLTGGSTVSAGETFTQALLDRPGGTVRVGEATQGVFSDTMDRKLPNGMEVWLPNETFLTRSGTTFDGAGIPPHLRTPVFTDQEFAGNRDSAFDTAVAVLAREGGREGKRKPRP
ncbi:S41 family peptidase [Streptomyces sp. NPDC102467]|uniref:S41 family peptidase n=1 Tax=Streptomyces sp. NPDC102467 TaxID=3366179 RepID=UPI00382146B3